MNSPKTTGVVLAGQHLWRDSRFDRLSPRPLLPVANRPLFWYAVQWLTAAGIGEIALTANAETRALRTALASMPEVRGLSLHEDKAPRGPAGSVRDATIDSDAQTIVVVDGTSVPATNLQELVAYHHASCATATVLVHPEPGRAAASGRFIPAGIYVFDRRAVERVPARGYDDIKEGLLPRLYDAGEKTAAYTVAESSPRALDAPSYLALNDWTLERLTLLPPLDGYVPNGSAHCHETAIISSDAVLVGQVLVGPEAQVLGGATIIGPTSVDAGSVVERRALVSRSAVWCGCIIGEDAVADRCIVPDGATLGPRDRAIGQVLERIPLGRAAATASERRARASFLGFRPDILISD